MTLLDDPTHPSAGSVLDDLVRTLAEMIEVPVDELDVDTPLINLGADSIILIEAMMYLEETYDLELRASQLVEELNTLDRLAVYIDTHLAAGNGARPADPTGAPEVVVDLRPAVPIPDAPRSDAPPSDPPAPDAPADVAQVPSFSSWIPEPGPHAVASPTDAPSRQLVDRFDTLLSASKAHAERYRSTHADPRAVAGFRAATKEVVVPVIASRARGPLMWDLDGHEYLDMAMGFGSLLLGHNHPAITAAVTHQLGAMGGVGAVSFLAGPLSEEITRLTGQQRVSFVTTGTEAVMLALRLARTATGRRRVAVFRGAYHGWWEGTLALPGRGPGAAVAATGGSVGDPATDLLLLNWDDPASLDLIEAHRGELAAVIAEPVQSRQPGRHCGPFLATVRDACTTAGAVLVFDEMITGFRLAPGGAAERFGVAPDLVTYGKALGGGLPIGCVAGRAEILDLLDGGSWRYGDTSAPSQPATFGAGTFAKHPLSMAAAWAFVTELRQGGTELYHGLEDRSASLQAGANAVLADSGVPARLERCGSMMRIMSRRNLDALFAALLTEGVYLWEGRTMFLSAAHTDTEVARFVDALAAACAHLDTAPSTSRAPEPDRGGPPLPETPPVPAEDAVEDAVVVEFPLTPNQAQLSFAYRSGSDVAEGFHNVAVVDFDGPLDIAAVDAALAVLIRRHDSMRSTFDLTRGVERLHATSLVRLDVTDLTRRGRGEIDEIIDREVLQACCTPFDLESGPLWRIRLVRATATHARMVIACSDLVADGWSLAIILREFAALYDAQLTGTTAALDEPVRLTDLRRWFGDIATRERLAADQRHWVETLADADLSTPLPPTDPNAVDRYVKTRARRSISAATMDTVRACARSAGTTPVTTLLGVFAALVHRVGGRDDFVIGIPTNGRPNPALRTLVASLATPVAIRVRVDDTATISDLCRSVQAAVFEALDRPVPIDAVARLVARRTGVLAPVTPVMFNFDPIPEVPAFADGTTMRIGNPERTFGLVPFSAEACPANDGSVSFSFDASGSMYDPAMVECWADYFMALIDDLPTNLDATIADVALGSHGR